MTKQEIAVRNNEVQYAAAGTCTLRYAEAGTRRRATSMQYALAGTCTLRYAEAGTRIIKKRNNTAQYAVAGTFVMSNATEGVLMLARLLGSLQRQACKDKTRCCLQRAAPLPTRLIPN